MAAPGAFINPNNKYNSIVGPTWAGGNSNAVYALNDPLKASIQRGQMQKRYQAGMTGQPPSMDEMYGQQSSPSYGFGSSRGYGGGQGYGQGYPDYHSQSRIGNPGGVMAPPSPTAGGQAPSGLAGLYNIQRPGNGPLDSINDQAAIQSYFQNTPTQGYNFNRMMAPGAFQAPPPAVGGQGAGGTTFNPATGNWERDVTPRYKGGPVGAKPYLVGEKGPEIYQSEDGEQELIGAQGPEIRTFPKDGKIIPNKDVKKYMLTTRAMGGPVSSSNYPGIPMTALIPAKPYGAYPSIQMVQPRLTARAGGGGVRGSGMPQPVTYGPPPMQYGQAPTGISPYAMQYLPQAPVDPQYAAAAQAAQNDPNAPSSPWAMARYIRMGLQSAARQKLTQDAAYQAVAERKTLQGLIGQGGSFTPKPRFSTQPDFNIPNLPPGQSAFVTQAPQGMAPHGMFTALDISGNPAQFPMSAPQGDPGASTFPIMNTLANAAARNDESPLQKLMRGVR